MLSRLMESICVVPQLILGPVAQGERNPEALKRIVLKKIAQPHRVDTVMLAFMPG
jgi:hypothetical protein